MDVAILIGIAIAIVFVVILLTLPKKEKEITTGQLMSTPEGRELYKDIQAKFRGRLPSDKSFETCPSCEGHGRTHHGVIMELGVSKFSTWGEHCPECGGTGIKGGLDYVVGDCPNCGGTGSKDGVKCSICMGTRIIRREKGEVKENA